MKEHPQIRIREISEVRSDEPGAPVTSGSDNGLAQKRPPSDALPTPTLAGIRSRRNSDGACVSAA